MGIITRVASRLGYEKRSSISDPNFWINNLSQSQSAVGRIVTPALALRLSYVYACVRVLAETLAMLPIEVFKRRGETKQERTDHPLSPILATSPNQNQTAFELLEMLMGHACLRGNAYSQVIRDGAGSVTAILPLNPANVTVLRYSDGSIWYQYIHSWDDTADLIDNFEMGNITYYPASAIWHVKGLSGNGLVGYSPITLQRESIGLAMATEEYGARFFSNSARPGGLLKHPGKLSQPAAQRLKESWEQAQGGLSQAHRVAVLEEGLEWVKVSVDNTDAQFLETRKFQLEDIARIYRIPLPLLQHQEISAAYKSVEQFFLSFGKFTMAPWARRFEQSIARCLFTPYELQKGYYAEFNMDALLRGDLLSRYQAYQIAVQNKWLSTNEVRALESFNPRAGGDVYENPNVTPANPAASADEGQSANG